MIIVTGDFNISLLFTSLLPARENLTRPEGTQAPSDHNPLVHELSDVASYEGGIRKQHINLVNRIGLHNCNSNCFRSRRKNKQDTALQKY